MFGVRLMQDFFYFYNLLSFFFYFLSWLFLIAIGVRRQTNAIIYFMYRAKFVQNNAELQKLYLSLFYYLSTRFWIIWYSYIDLFDFYLSSLSSNSNSSWDLTHIKHKTMFKFIWQMISLSNWKTNDWGSIIH